MLTPGTHGWTAAPRGSRRHDAMTQADAAAMCAGMTDAQWAVFGFVYAGDDGRLCDARRAVMVAAAELAGRWPVNGPGSRRLEQLCELALLDLREGYLARARRELKDGIDEDVAQRALSRASAARHLGVSRTAWWRTWDARYAQVHREAALLLSQAEACIVFGPGPDRRFRAPLGG